MIHLISLLLTLTSATVLDDFYYLRTYYGPRFHVDYDYPLQVTYDEYCHFVKDFHVDNSTSGITYPPNLWLALIHTVPSKISNIINTRATWCQQQLQEKYGFKCIFVLVESTVDASGKRDDLLQMNATHHDIYFIEMPELKEQWFTLQQKNINSYIMAMDLFPNYSFYARVDDQIMVTVDVLSTLLVKLMSQFPSTPLVVGDIVTHRPMRNARNKYFDPLAQQIPFYFPFPAGYLSLFSHDIIAFVASWDNYYSFAPSSLEDPGFGHWVYKFSRKRNVKVEIIHPYRWGGNVKSMSDDYIVYHRQRGFLSQHALFEQQKARGYLQV